MIRLECPPDHKHAETASCYVTHRCRCVPCTAGNTARQDRRRRLIAYGRHQARLVDASEARARIQAARAEGWSLRQIAAAAGVGDRSVWAIASGAQARAYRATVEKLTGFDLVHPTGRMPAIGAQRRVQALAYMGWTNEDIQNQMGAGDSMIPWLFRQEQITPVMHARVAAVYDALWDQTPPDTYGNRRAAARARARGWVGPLAYDDDTIDLPDARPAQLKETA